MNLDWTTIISTLIGTGGLVGFLAFFLTATEKKSNAQLTNMQKQYDNLQALYDKLQERFDVETDKVGKLYDEIGTLHTELDARSTRAAIAEMKVCDCIACTQRRPPLRDHWDVDFVPDFSNDVTEEGGENGTVD